MEDRTVIPWDKDDIDSLKILKVDILALGMLSCIRKALDLVEAHCHQRFDLATLPPEDPATYDMLCQADSLGVFSGGEPGADEFPAQDAAAHLL